MRPSGGGRVWGEPVAQRLGRTRAREVEVAFEDRFPGRGGKHCAAPAGGRGFCARQGGLGPLAHAGRRAIERLADERGDDPETELGVGLCLGVEGPGDRGANVVELGVETREPRRLVGSLQAAPGRLGEARVVLGVTAAMLLDVTGVVETLERILTKGLEEPVTRGGVGAVVEDDHRLRGQIVERVAHIPGGEPVVARDRGRGVGVEAPGEDPEAVEDRAFAFVEQRIGPLDGCPQRLLTLDAAAPAAGEEPEPLVEQPRDLGRTHAGNPRGGELDREWDRVEASTDFHDLLRVRRVELQARPGRLRPIHEQLHRFTRRDFLQARLRRRWDAQRRHPQQSLPGHAERLPARRQHPHPRRRAQDRLGDLGRCVQQVLAVVQHDQRLLARQVVTDALGQRPPRP